MTDYNVYKVYENDAADIHMCDIFNTFMDMSRNNKFNATDRVLVLTAAGKIFEVGADKTFTKLNCKLVEIDYNALVAEKIEELCSAISYESNAGKPYKTESTMYDKIIGNKVTDLIDTDDVDISSVKIKSVIDFLINIKPEPEVIETLKSMMSNVVKIDPNLDLASILTYGVQMILKEGTAEIVTIKKVLLVASILMAYIEKRKLEKAAAAEKAK
jgi:hypothetical protein